MKKIGIITFSNSTNYGGVLQSVALSRTLVKLGMEPTNITYQKMPGTWNSVQNYVERRVRLYGSKGLETKLRICGGICKTILSNVHYMSVKKKQANFKEFIKKYLNTTPCYGTHELLKRHCVGYDAFITGSDQVWNNVFSYNKFIGAYFLDFVPKGVPCYSYAASAGGKKTDQYVKEIIERTQHFEGITVREKSLEDHMRRLGCNRVETALDPTLLVKKDEWVMMEKRPKRYIPEHYILVYYLEKDVVHDPVIKKLTKKLGLPVVDIMPNYHKSEYDRMIDDTAGPAEFIYYVNHADYIVTNSFHMVAFSLIFGKRFVALQREGQESRINDLLKMVDCSERYIGNEKKWYVIKRKVKDISPYIEQEREKSLNYLKKIGENL